MTYKFRQVGQLSACAGRTQNWRQLTCLLALKGHIAYYKVATHKCKYHRLACLIDSVIAYIG